MIIGYDNGFGWNKALGASEYRQPSVIGEGRELFEGTLKPDDIQLWDGERHYFVGKLAVRQSLIPQFCTGDNKARSGISLILMKAALGAVSRNEPIDLVTGLPVDYFQSQKKDYATLIEEFNSSPAYRMQIGDSEFSCCPRVRNYKIVPQPFGSAMNYFLDDSGQIVHPEATRQRILVIDPGYYTLDLLILDRMEIGKASRSPAHLGIDTAYRIVQSALREQTGRAPSRQELDRCVLAGEYEGLNIIPIRQQAFRVLGEQISNEIESLNEHFDRYIVTGGWASELAQFLRIPRDRLIVMDGMGNVRGYRKVGVRLWPASACGRAKTTTLSQV